MEENALEGMFQERMLWREYFEENVLKRMFGSENKRISDTNTCKTGIIVFDLELSSFFQTVRMLSLISCVKRDYFPLRNLFYSVQKDGSRSMHRLYR